MRIVFPPYGALQITASRNGIFHPGRVGGGAMDVSFLPHTPKKGAFLHLTLGIFPAKKEIPNLKTITEWWFQIFFIFTPKFGEDEPILMSIVFRWVEVQKPPTRSETIMIFRKSKSTKLCRIRLGIGNPCSIHWIILSDQPATSVGRLGEFLGIILMVRPVGSEQLRIARSWMSNFGCVFQHGR